MCSEDSLSLAQQDKIRLDLTRRTTLLLLFLLELLLLSQSFLFPSLQFLEVVFTNTLSFVADIFEVLTGTLIGGGERGLAVSEGGVVSERGWDCVSRAEML